MMVRKASTIAQVNSVTARETSTLAWVGSKMVARQQWHVGMGGFHDSGREAMT
jgi:hypothetical protein